MDPREMYLRARSNFDPYYSRGHNLILDIAGRPSHVILDDDKLHECYQMFKKAFPHIFEEEALKLIDKNNAKAKEPKKERPSLRDMLKLML